MRQAGECRTFMKKPRQQERPVYPRGGRCVSGRLKPLVTLQLFRPTPCGLGNGRGPKARSKG